MTKMRISTQKKNSNNFRFGQDFTYENVKHAWRRQPYGSRLVVGVVEQAIGKGFNVIDTETNKPVEKNAEIKEIVDTMWVDLKKSIFYDRAYGKSLGSFYMRDGHDIPIWRAYDINDYRARYDELGFPTYYNVTNRVGGMDAKADMKEIIDDDLRFTYEIIIRQDETKGEGLSVIEPVWDTLYALISLDEQGTYYAIRYGSGIRFIKVPEKKFKDTAFMTNLMAMLRGASGSNSVYALPYVTLGNGLKEDMEVGNDNAVQIKFLELRDLIIGSLSAQTGIPREVWLGSQTGLRSSEENRDAFFDYLQTIQEQYKPFFKWIINMLNGLFGWFGENIIIGIEYVIRDTLNKDEKVELLGKKVKIVNDAGYKIPLDWLAEQVDIPLEERAIDPLGINGDNPAGGDEGDGDEEGDGADDDEDDESFTANVG